MILEQLFFPSKCPFCGKLTDKNIKDINKYKCCACNECAKEIKFFEDGGSGAESGLECSPSCDKIFNLFSYRGKGKEAIIQFKFCGQTWIGKLFGTGLYWLLEKNNLFEDIFAITYVPVSEERFAERGFNQSEILANEISKESGKPVFPMLERRFQGNANSTMNSAERKEKNQGKYSVNKNILPYLNGKKILLVDDILTSGATIEECALRLKEAGAEKVFAACVATGRRDI